MIKRFNPDFSLSISHELAYMRETPEGGYVAHGDYATLFSELELVKADRDALAERVERLSGMLTESRHATKAAVERADALAVENAALNSGCGFFAYDPDNGFEEFKTKEEAIAAAESYIDYYRGEACDGWPDEVAQVSWGIIMQESTRVNERPRTNDDSCDPAIETVCDYALLPNIETPATSAALAAIEARFCGLLDTYEKVEPERFNPEFADLYAKIVNRIFSSVMDNPSVTDLESLTDYLESSAENSRAYADMSMKFHAELREAK